MAFFGQFVHISFIFPQFCEISFSGLEFSFFGPKFVYLQVFSANSREFPPNVLDWLKFTSNVTGTSGDPTGTSCDHNYH